jgi:dehydrogenase/reductase SDR family protein 7
MLVNNAGQSMSCLVEKTPFHVDQEIININLLGAISLTKAVLPHMIERKQGQITVVSSVWGKHGN